jgi:hypothetical protein
VTTYERQSSIIHITDCLLPLRCRLCVLDTLEQDRNQLISKYLIEQRHVVSSALTAQRTLIRNKNVLRFDITVKNRMTVKNGDGNEQLFGKILQSQAEHKVRCNGAHRTNPNQIDAQRMIAFQVAFEILFDVFEDEIDILPFWVRLFAEDFSQSKQ